MSSQIAKSAESLGIGAYQPPRMTRIHLSALARAARGRLRTRRSGAAAGPPLQRGRNCYVVLDGIEQTLVSKPITISAQHPIG